MKITAIHSGEDWADATAEYLILPKHINIELEHKEYNKWVDKVYLPDLRIGNKPKHITFCDWLITKGARMPTNDELEVYYPY